MSFDMPESLAERAVVRIAPPHVHHGDTLGLQSCFELSLCEPPHRVNPNNEMLSSGRLP